MLRQHTNISIIIGAGIIGLSLIVGLNFAEFVGWTRYAFYHLSGQAAADKLAREQYSERLRLQQAEAEHKQAEEAARDQQMRTAEVELKKALGSAWDGFLGSNIKSFKQITIIEDARNGDYVCLRNAPPAPTRSAEDQLRAMYDEKIKAEDAKRTADFWNYQIQDRVADGFLQWLNNRRVFNQANWSYDDLKAMNSYNLLGMFITRPRECQFPSDVWRANRYQKKLQ
jgi:hypothetical protein